MCIIVRPTNSLLPSLEDRILFRAWLSRREARPKMDEIPTELFGSWEIMISSAHFLPPSRRARNAWSWSGQTKWDYQAKNQLLAGTKSAKYSPASTRVQ